MTDSFTIDKRSRDLIVSDTNHNFFVEAGAGSGKTTMLVSRMVAMVEQGKPIDQICAITFTRAAAGEFYDRFQKKLIERSNPSYVWKDNGFAGQLPAPTDESRRRCAEALQDIDRCFMGTIDSFCGMLLSEHPFEAGVPSGAAVISDEDALVLYKQAFVEICKGAYEKEFPGLQAKTLGFTGLFRGAEDTYAKAMSYIMGKRNITFRYTEKNCPDIDAEFAQERAQILGIIRSLLNHPEIKYDGNQGSRDAWDLLEDAYDNLSRRWSKNYQGVVYMLGKLTKLAVIPGAEQICPALMGELTAAGKTAKSYVITCLSEETLSKKMEALRYDLAMTCLFSCIPLMESIFRERGYLSYFDALYYLRNMLRKDAEEGGKLISYIGKHHRYFLIDEFQDTDPMQAEVFFYLTAEKPSGEWKECNPKAGSLFIVGDPKQSIYRFRGADVASFLTVRGLFENGNGEVLKLTRNFRSTDKLCGFFNDVFTKMMPEVTENQSAFDEIPVTESIRSDEFGGIFYYDVAGDIPGHDALQIGEVISRLVDNSAYTITDGGESVPRPICYSDFMVITSSKAKLTPIVQVLDGLGIPSKVEGKVLFEENEALREIGRICNCIAYGDRMSLYGALTGKVFGFVPGDIVTFTEKVDRIDLRDYASAKEIPEGICREVATAIKELTDLRKEAASLSPAAVFMKIMDRFRIYETLPAENLEILYYTLEMIRSRENSGQIVSLQDCAAFLNQLVTGETEEERCLSLTDAADCVHLANLHKVKGLEAPIVILAEAADGPVKPEVHIVRQGNNAEGYLFEMKGEGFASLFKTNAFAEQAEDEKAAIIAERQRLVYVAATRARNALIIGTKGKSKWGALLADGSAHDFFLSAAENASPEKTEAEPASAKQLYDEAAASSVLNNRESEQPTYIGRTPSDIKLPTRLEGDEESGTAVPILMLPEDEERRAKKDLNSRDVHNRPTLLGSCVHRLMEVLVTSENRVDIDTAVVEIVEEFRCEDSEGFERPLKKALKAVAETMRNGGFPQVNGAPQDLLSILLSAEEVHCEWPFCFKEEKDGETILWNGIMDLVYKADGKWHIIDYKTNLESAGLDEHYRSQLEAYIKALKEITGEDADALIYHIAI